MSAFLVSEAHIDALIQAGIHYGQPYLLAFGDVDVAPETATTIGNALWEENRKSIRARYGADRVGVVSTYTYKPTLICRDRDPIVILKLIACYEYQSCEHEGWESSAAHKFCEELRRIVVGELPGYENAPWGI